MASNKKYSDALIQSMASNLVIDEHEPEIVHGDDIEGKIAEEPILGRLLITWNLEFSILNIDISYSSSYWLFRVVTNIEKSNKETTELSNFLPFIFGKLASFAKLNTDATEFLVYVSEVSDSSDFLSIGFTEKENQIYSVELYGVEYKTSKLEEYLNWINTGEVPNLEPSWRKAIN